MFKAPKTLLFAVLVGFTGFSIQGWAAKNQILGELALKSANGVEKDAGVWVNGQYLGFLKELKGKRKVLLLPGDHELALRLSGFQEVKRTISMQPGEKKVLRVSMEPDPNVHYPDLSEAGQVHLDIEPERAAVYVDGNYAGHVDEFNGRKGLWVSAGKHEFEIKLPGYQSFVTEITVNKGQRYKLQTELHKGVEEQEEAE